MDSISDSSSHVSSLEVEQNESQSLVASGEDGHVGNLDSSEIVSFASISDSLSLTLSHSLLNSLTLDSMTSQSESLSNSLSLSQSQSSQNSQSLSIVGGTQFRMMARAAVTAHSDEILVFTESSAKGQLGYICLVEGRLNKTTNLIDWTVTFDPPGTGSAFPGLYIATISEMGAPQNILMNGMPLTNDSSSFSSR